MSCDRSYTSAEATTSRFQQIFELSRRVQKTQVACIRDLRVGSGSNWQGDSAHQ